MQLVGMQHDHLAGQAVLKRTAIMEALHAIERDPDGIGVVPVQLEGITVEARLDALEAGGAGRRNDPVVVRARTFKTFQRLIA